MAFDINNNYNNTNNNDDKSSTNEANLIKSPELNGDHEKSSITHSANKPNEATLLYQEYIKKEIENDQGSLDANNPNQANGLQPIFNQEAIEQLLKRTGYPMVQENGQRKYGPMPNWGNAPEPDRGCEVFVGKIPRDCFEDEIIPVIEKIGPIYEFRLMMEYSGYNRG